ncbi:hypothetical protein POM88_053696 [Heracleum sosnowskyi]|uniref:Uncharacterized protein n=1 Tax=Heracleum sosnowskyi TaxID=360622 RepID=A0AAD8GNC4_9APIA|nr:hypothetical protein POM88_053696 [Heracleum sosnowskyi]
MAIRAYTSGESGKSSRGGRGNGKGGKGRGLGGMVVEEGARVMEEEVVVEEGAGVVPGLVSYLLHLRSCSEGDYRKPPAPRAPKAIVHFIDGKCIREPKKKKTLGYIIKVLWDENTHHSKGAECEAFYDLYLQKFKEYYDYQKGIDEVEGDRAVKEHMKVNLSNLPYLEKRRADRDASAKRKAGYKATRRTYRPHYFNQRTWDSLNTYWESDLFKKRSRIGKNARGHQEHAHHSGAIPFSQRREDMEAEKEGPVSNYDFMNTVYHFEKLADLKLKEDMERMMATQSTPKDSSTTDPPLSPRSQKKMQLKKYFSLTLQVRPPRKGKTILFPQHTVSEFVLRVSGDMNRLVHSLEMQEVPRFLLNERMHLLANEAFPNRDHDPEQQQSWFKYLRLATSFVVDAMVLYKKVILEVIVDALYSTPYVGS